MAQKEIGYGLNSTSSGLDPMEAFCLMRMKKKCWSTAIKGSFDQLHELQYVLQVLTLNFLDTACLFSCFQLDFNWAKRVQKEQELPSLKPICKANVTPTHAQ